MTIENRDPVADMIAEGGPTREKAIADHARAREILVSVLSLEKPITVRMSEIPLGSAVVDGGPEQIRMVGEGGNPHGQH
jgi:hypothetical protein